MLKFMSDVYLKKCQKKRSTPEYKKGNEFSLVPFNQSAYCSVKF